MRLNFIILSTSHFLAALLAQQAGGVDQQHADEHAEADGVGELGGDVAGGEDLDDAQQQTAQQGAGDGADAAEDGGGKGLDAGHGAGGGGQVGIGGAEEHTGNGRQGGADGKGDGNGGVDVNTHKLGRALILGTGPHGLAHL